MKNIGSWSRAMWLRMTLERRRGLLVKYRNRTLACGRDWEPRVILIPRNWVDSDAVMIVDRRSVYLMWEWGKEASLVRKLLHFLVFQCVPRPVWGQRICRVVCLFVCLDIFWAYNVMTSFSPFLFSLQILHVPPYIALLQIHENLLFFFICCYIWECICLCIPK